MKDIRIKATEVVLDWSTLYSLRLIASALDVSPSTVHRWVLGYSTPTRRISKHIIDNRKAVDAALKRDAA